MMNGKSAARALLAVIPGLWMTGCPLRGGLIMQQALSSLTQSADAIAVGSASGSLQLQAPGVFSLDVVRLVKGPASLAGTTILVHWTPPLPGVVEPGASFPANGAGIWFLKSAEGGWSLLPVVEGSTTFGMTHFPAPVSSLPAAYAYPVSASLPDKLASELAVAIEAWDGSYIHAFYGLFSGDLDQLASPAVHTLYERLSASSSVRQRILGLTGLIIDGDASALARAVSHDASFSEYGLERGRLLLAIRELFRSAAPEAIATLGQTATSASAAPDLRTVAAHALAAIHNAATLPYLATLFDDPDLGLRMEAIGGMSAFANGLPTQTAAGTASLAYLQVPSGAPFKTADTMSHLAIGAKAIGANEGSYLSFWRAWWQENRASLGY